MSSELVPYAPKGIWRPKGTEPVVMFSPIRIPPELAEQLSRLRTSEDWPSERDLAEIQERAIAAARTNIARPGIWLEF